jgi:hypothetical protein
MHLRARFRCDRVRLNNGIVEAFFTRRSVGAQDEQVLINVMREYPVQYQEGKYYRITIEAVDLAEIDG